jgi:peptidoglycan-associated lipoprotein
MTFFKRGISMNASVNMSALKSLKLLSVAVLMGLFLSLSACKSSRTTGDEASTESEIPTADAQTIPSDVNSGDDNSMGDSDSDKAMGLKTVFFPYDSFELTTEARDTLQANADILTANPTAKIQIEGHCDQRGGIQYNIALGEKRANAIRQQLVRQYKIEGARITTISYGKERPLDATDSEEAYAKNRRGNFAVTAK